ncbi:MAG TPA: hypothetical protein ENH35_02200 [Candidatus Moranbacteria bacterium]|nr:hypothetical protein [Candidatus Moranbacteria bacterium]HDZ85341.1 hypothetical protein [Candidatus Moranbacteria bacterium]
MTISEIFELGWLVIKNIFVSFFGPIAEMIWSLTYSFWYLLIETRDPVLVALLIVLALVTVVVVFEKTPKKTQ